MALLLAVLAAAGIASLRLWPGAIARLIDQADGLERGLGAAGWVLAALIQVLIALCGILPASVGALAAGLVYGIGGGFLLSAIGTLVGAGLAFGLTRSLFRPLMLRLLRRRPAFARLDDAVAQDGWRLVCLLRVSPVMPFAVTSYALGLTGMTFRSYAIGTLASLPALLGYVVLGHLSRSGLAALAAHQTGWLRWTLLGLAIAASALLTLKLGGIVRRVMRLPADGAGLICDAATRHLPKIDSRGQS
nr:VTT domain-containing protein [uncultured Lichenicoccus sp.]